MGLKRRSLRQLSGHLVYCQARIIGVGGVKVNQAWGEENGATG